MLVHNRFVTVGVTDRIPREVQIAMWDMLDTMECERSSTQRFELAALDNGAQHIVHTQRSPDYSKEICLQLSTSVTDTVVVYDDGRHTIMMLGEETDYDYAPE